MNILQEEKPKIIYDQIPGKKMVSFSFMVKVGVGTENKQNNGISHLLEHVVLRGTNKLSLNQYFDSIGGKYNAFTGREFTCYYAKVLQEDFNKAFSLLADYVFNPSFTEEDLDIEKKIVIEELLQFEDNLPQKVRSRALELATDNHPISYNILGKRNVINSISLKDLYSHHSYHYKPSNIVISISGNLNSNNLDFVKNELKLKLEEKNGDKNINLKVHKEMDSISGNYIEKNNANKSYICKLYKGCSRSDSNKILTLGLINQVLAGSRTAILNQYLREEGGYVYNLYSYPIIFDIAGFIGVFTSTSPNKETEVHRLIDSSIKKLVEEGLSKELFLSAKKSMKSEYIFNMENTSDRMFFFGRKALFKENYYDDFESKLDGITLESVNEMAQEIFKSDSVCYVSSGNGSL